MFQTFNSHDAVAEALTKLDGGARWSPLDVVYATNSLGGTNNFGTAPLPNDGLDGEGRVYWKESTLKKWIVKHNDDRLAFCRARAFGALSSPAEPVDLVTPQQVAAFIRSFPPWKDAPNEVALAMQGKPGFPSVRIPEGTMSVNSEALRKWLFAYAEDKLNEAAQRAAPASGTPVMAPWRDAYYLFQFLRRRRVGASQTSL